MSNPFQYGGVVSREAFCNRKKELSDILKAMENSDNLFIYSERRLGKTSLVRLALENLSKKHYVAAYVDLWPTDGEDSFATATARTVSEAASTSVDRALDTAKTFFGRLAPSVTVDEQGKPQVTFGVSRTSEPDLDLEEVLAAPAKIAAQGRRKVVVVFDEFQQILEYGSDRVERRLRSAIQMHQKVSYIFLGSRKHLIQKMFLDRSRPLYRAGGHYPLGMIEEKHWMPFIRERFHGAKKRIADEQIHSLCRLSQGHPFYTQHLCHVLWDLCEEGAEVTEGLIEMALQTLLERESYAYTTLWESFSVNQRRFLKGLASETGSMKPFASDFIRQYRLRSASNVQRALEPLLERDVVDRDNGSFIITDRFFRIWIQKRIT